MTMLDHYQRVKVCLRKGTEIKMPIKKEGRDLRPSLAGIAEDKAELRERNRQSKTTPF
jgi:hypothetical protein